MVALPLPILLCSYSDGFTIGPKKIWIRIEILVILKLKPFGVLASIEIVVSVRRLFTETMMSINAKTANGLSPLCLKLKETNSWDYSNATSKKVLPHCGLWPLSFLASVFYFIWRIFLLAQLASLGKTLIINSCVIVPQPYLSVFAAHYNLYIHVTTHKVLCSWICNLNIVVYYHEWIYISRFKLTTIFVIF